MCRNFSYCCFVIKPHQKLVQCTTQLHDNEIVVNIKHKIKFNKTIGTAVFYTGVTVYTGEEKSTVFKTVSIIRIYII